LLPDRLGRLVVRSAVATTVEPVEVRLTPLPGPI